MKNWCKIIKLDEYDVSVMRLSTTEEGEHVELIARFPEGQFIKTASFEENKEEAKETPEAKDNPSAPTQEAKTMDNNNNGS